MIEPFFALLILYVSNLSRTTTYSSNSTDPSGWVVSSVIQSRAWEAAMALKEVIYFWRTKGLGPGIDRNGEPLELFASGGRKSSFARRKGVGLKMVLSTRRRSATSHGTTISLQQRLDKLSLLPSTNRSQILLTGRSHWNVCRAKNSDEDDTDDNNKVYDRNGFDKNGRDRSGRDQFGVDSEGLDEMGIPEDAIFDSPITQPEYVSYIDPNTGEPSPTYGFRNPLPDAAFWGEDLSRIQRTSPSSAAVERFPRSSIGDGKAKSSEPEASDIPSPRKRTRAGGKRKKKENSVEPDELHSEDLSEEELANIAQLESLKNKFRAEEEAGTYKSIAQVIKESKEDDKAEEVDGGVSEVGEGEEEGNEDVSLGKLFGESGFGDRGYALVGGDKANEKDIVPLTNEELWWNWQKPPPDKKPWSAWQKRAGDSDTVMAAAMAETGQIKLFGEKPTIAEATLARARKRVFYNERMAAEEARKKEIGPLAYYKEWVKAYKGDTSKEAVQRHFEETGEDEGLQLLDLFAYQTAEEYRIMMGTDIRIRRDPLTMRMREDQIKQVWGGDPVYPTVNYEHDPDSIADYRNENMHEPIPNILDLLRESGRLLTQEEVKAMLEQEKIEEDELDIFEGSAEAVGVGDDDDEDLFEEDDEEIEFEDDTAVQSMLAKTIVPLQKSPPDQQVTFELDEVTDAEEVNEVIDVDGKIIDLALDGDGVDEVTHADEKT